MAYFFVRAMFFTTVGVLLGLGAPLLDQVPERGEPELDKVATPAPKPFSRLEVRLKPGDTLLELLTQHGLSVASAHALITQMRPVLNPRRLQSGKEVDLVVDNRDRSLQQLEIDLDDNVVRAKAMDEGWMIEREEVPFSVHSRLSRGTISSSLYDNGMAAGLSAEQVMELAKIFEYDIDFFSDFKKGDRFEVIIEEARYANGRRVAGRVLTAELEKGGQLKSAFYFVPKNGDGAYYDAEGRELRRSFLRAPLSFYRISSFFSLARRHPIFRTLRPHLAIDYAAPTGTPVVAIGRGKVSRSGWYPGYGNFVEITHSGGYSSRYGHFSRIARGVRRGTAINAGEVIGFVGQTGHATGPHLHFEFLQGGRNINFLGLKIPRTERLSGAELARFQRERRALIAANSDSENSPTS